MTATLTVCTAKATAEMFKQTFAGCNQFTGGGVVIMLVFLCTIFAQ